MKNKVIVLDEIGPHFEVNVDKVARFDTIEGEKGWPSRKNPMIQLDTLTDDKEPAKLKKVMQLDVLFTDYVPKFKHTPMVLETIFSEAPAAEAPEAVQLAA